MATKDEVSERPAGNRTDRFTSPNVAGIPPKLPGETDHAFTMRLSRWIMDRDAGILQALAK